MHPGRADFSYTYFRQLLSATRAHFTAHCLSDAPALLQNPEQRPTLFLRHDIKIALHCALPLAEIEQEYNLPATYMIRADSPLYSLSARDARVHLLELLQMGHEIGLHFDLPSAEHQSKSFSRIIELRIRVARERIEQIICRPVRTISLQRQLPLFFNGPLMLEKLVNADAQELRQWYISDAGGEWREGEPLATITNPRSHLLQLILHPAWWGYTNLSAQQRLQELFDIATYDKQPREAGLFDIDLAKTVPAVRRQGVSALR